MKRFACLFIALALPGGLWAACAPTSATLTFAADDYLYFYINGNAVVAPSGFDPGNPPVSVSVPVGYFNAPGVPNYFAAAIRNSAANLVGGNWVLSIQCAGGSMSYITNEDNTFTMYDDINGSAPPPANWFDPAFTDPGSLFTATPVLAPAISWFNPKLTHPLTGVVLQMLSHSVSGTQFSDNEVLYFRQTIVLPVYSPTPSPSPSASFTASPTPYPPGCGLPVFEDARLIASGCLSPGGGNHSYAYNMGVAANQVLILRIETTASSTLPGSVAYGGVPMTLHSTGTSGYSSTRLHTYYLASPPTGPNNVTFTNPTGCNWNIGVEVYSNVDVVTPLGPHNGTQAGSGDGVTGAFTVPISTTGFASLVSVFMASEQVCNAGDVPVLGPLQVDHAFRSNGVGMACCECSFGDHKPVGGAGSHSLSYDLAQNNRQYYAQPIEIRGNQCATLTATPTFSHTPQTSPSATPTATPSASPILPSPTVTATSSATLSPSQTLTPSQTPTPSHSTTPTAAASATPAPTATWTPAPLALTPRRPNPNPARNAVWIPFELSAAAEVSIRVFDVSGEAVRNLDPMPRAAGAYEAYWDLLNSKGQMVASGVYLCRITAQGATEKDEAWVKVAVTR